MATGNIVKCNNCYYFERFDKSNSDKKFGHCKRYAPAPRLTPDAMLYNLEWPTVNRKDWCGEFSQRGKD